MQIVIDNAEIVVRHIIGADCTFSHNERHKVLKGYLEVEEEQEPCEKCEVGNPCLYCKHEFEPQESEE